MMQLRELRLTGRGVSDARMIFKPGGNVVSGDSDTGKSYMLRCIDYVFGAEAMTKVITEAEHLHSTEPHYEQAFEQFCYRLGVGEAAEHVSW